MTIVWAQITSILGLTGSTARYVGRRFTRDAAVSAFNSAQLRAAYKAKLDEWGLKQRQVEQRGWQLLTVEEAVAKVGHAVCVYMLRQAQGCVLIPYLDWRGEPILYANGNPYFQLRFLGQLPTTREGRPLRYLSPNGSGVHLYIPTLDPDIPQSRADFNLTEGPAKIEAATAAGYMGAAFTGTACWRTPEMEQVNFAERRVNIVYDSDAAINPDVSLQENALAKWLADRGAHPYIIRLPSLPGLKKTGWDDFLRLRGKEAFEKLLNEADEFVKAEKLYELNAEVRYVRNPSAIVKLANGQVMSVSTFVNEAYKNVKWEETIETNKGVRRRVAHYAAKEWMEWEHRGEVERMTYAPGAERITPDGHLNRWRGWACEPKPGDARPWRELLDFLFADAPQRKWFEQWLAYPLQHPGAKLYTAVVIWGAAQGTGKTLIGHTMYRIYGYKDAKANATEITNEQLNSSFNGSWAEMKQFVMGEEITCSDDNKRTIYNRLKSWITQPILRINQKYVPNYEVPDCINYYFNSNSPDAFYIADEDRRFFVHHVTATEALPKSFYNSYGDWLNSGGAAALFDYLLKLDLTGFDPTAKAPETHARREMIEGGRSHAEQWADALRNAPDEVLQVGYGRLDTKLGSAKLPYSLFTTGELVALARSQMDDGDKRYINEANLGKALGKFGFAKVDNNQSGRIKVPNVGYVYLWIIRDAEKLRKITDPNKIRDLYFQEREQHKQQQAKETRP